jgi:cellulose synthase/poly-beta-1,6-N-acetylglucosamine synthase-like glycosyltransferase
VIADNCSDGTAKAAARHDVAVLERRDPVAFGKGHALAWGLDTIAPEHFDVVGIIDADTTSCGNAMELLARRSLATGRPVQGCYLHTLPPGADAWSAFSCFAVTVNNLIRQRGRQRLGVPCQVNGNGIFMPFDCARSVNWSSGSLAEDAALGLDLSLAGHDTLFEEHAIITTPAACGAARILAQRGGWMKGRLDLSARTTSRSLATSIRHGRMRAAIATLDLAIPPTSVLAAILVAQLACVLGAASAGVRVALPLSIWAIGASAFFTAMVLAWWTHGRTLITGRVLCRIPWILARQCLAVAAGTVRRRATWRDYRKPDC